VKEIVILGGPNGAGKTTAANVLLPEFLGTYKFLNADEIAREVSPGNVESAALAAGRILVERMRRYIRQGESFALETRCAGKSYVPTFKTCKENGWKIALHYFWLPSPELSIARVAKHVQQGGHHIPDEVIYRRFTSGLSNMLNLYLPLADIAKIYDNSGYKPLLIAEKRENSALIIHDLESWSRMKGLAQWK
jgi:predicted ABC-type ATPase